MTRLAVANRFVFILCIGLVVLGGCRGRGQTLQSISVTPNPATVATGSSVSLTAIGHYNGGITKDLTTSVVWSSSDTSVATIGNTTGVASGVKVGGPITISATSGTITGIGSLSVTPPPTLQTISIAPNPATVNVGSTMQFAATGHYSDSSTQNLTATATWTSSDATLATINVASGLAMGVKAGGPVTISARSGTIVGTSSLTVTAPPTLQTIVVTPNPGSVSVGTTLQFTATGHYSDSSTQNLTASAAWTSSDSTIAAINPATGLAMGVKAGGPVTITAKASGISGTAALTVTVAVTLQTITVTPNPGSVSVGNTLQFTATGHYSDSSTQNLTASAAWTSSDTTVATINPASGLATGVKVGGPVTITAINSGISGTTNLSVTVTGTNAWAATTNMQFARGLHTATLLNNGKVLMAGGNSNLRSISGAPLNSAELYDPSSQTFALTGSLKQPRMFATATLLDNGKVLIAGGQTLTSGTITTTATAELYDPAAGTFAFTGSMSAPRFSQTATLLSDGTVLLAGGTDDAGTALASAEIYDPSTGLFTPTGAMMKGRFGSTATLLNSGPTPAKVLIAGGGDGNMNTLASAELYNPTTHTFSFTGNLNTGRAAQTATLLNDGMVLIAGGVSASPGSPSIQLISAELYDPSGGSFRATGNMTSVRASDIGTPATLLNNGTVLIEGGAVATSTTLTVLASAEIYDPVSGTFSATGSMKTARLGNTATLLTNGQALAAGGVNIDSGGTATTLSQAESFDPSTLTPPGLLSITVAPVNGNISSHPGGTQRFVATGHFAVGPQTLVSVTWSSSNIAIATISNDSSNSGAALSVSAGTTTITASAGGISGSATLVVQ